MLEKDPAKRITLREVLESEWVVSPPRRRLQLPQRSTQSMQALQMSLPSTLPGSHFCSRSEGRMRGIVPNNWIANRKEDKSCKWGNEIEEESGSEDRRIEELKKKQVDLDRIVTPKENQFISYEQAPVAKSLSFAVRDSCFCLLESDCFEKVARYLSQINWLFTNLELCSSMSLLLSCDRFLTFSILCFKSHVFLWCGSTRSYSC